MADLDQSEFLRQIGVKAQPLVARAQESIATLPAREETTPGFESIAAPGEEGSGGAAPIGEEASFLLPASKAALDEVAGRVASSQGARPQAGENLVRDYAAKLGARPGVPFDTQTGVPFMTRLRMAGQPTKEEEFKALEAAYGAGKVKRNDFGDLVVTTKDAQGREMDKLADPIGLDVGDAASVLGQLPEIAGSILATARSGGAGMAPGVWNAAKTLLKMVGGAAAGGVAKDVGVRALEGQPIQPGEIAERRGEQAGADVAFGAGAGLAAKTGVTLFSPFSKPGPIQFNARQAQKEISAKYGVQLPLSPAEATGNTFLQRAEALESQKPGASVPFEAMMKEKRDKLGELQQIVLGGGAPDEEAAGQRALAALGAKVAPLTQNVEKSAAESANAAEDELRKGVGTAVDKATVGKAIDLGAKAERDAFEKVETAKWEALKSDPAFTDPVVMPKGLVGEINSFLEDLPKVRKEVQQTSPMLDRFGNPIVTTVEKDVPFETPIRPKLEEFASKLEGGKVSLNDLKGMRTDVGNALKGGEALTGVRDGRLAHLYGMLTTSIEDGLDQVKNSPLKKQWENAVEFTKAGHQRFDRAGIAELFREPINAIGPHELVDRAISSPDVYNAYKEFFGANSPQVRGVQQAIRDYTMGLSDLSSTVGAKAFVQRLEALPKDVRTDVFGAQASGLRSSAMALRAAEGETLPTAELQAMMKSGNLSADRVMQMLSAQATKTQAYRNEIVKAVSEGNLKPDTIKPTEVVNRLVFNSKTQPKDLAGVVDLLQDRPDVLEDMRRLSFKRALDDASFVNPQTGQNGISGDELEKLFTDENQAKRLRSILGTSTYSDLENIKDYLKAGGMVQKAAKGAGAFGASAQVAGLVERGAFKYLDRAAKNFVTATLYTSPAVKSYLSNTLLQPGSKAAIVNSVVASTPFLEALAKDAEAGSQRKVAGAIKASLDRYLRENPNEASSEPATATGAGGGGDIPWDQFLRQIGKSPETTK